jgi:predicted cobalt transporter CbtA
MCLGRSRLYIALGLMLIALPQLAHLMPHDSAPHAEAPDGAGAFVAASLALQFLAWLVPTVIAAWAMSRVGAAGDARAEAA